MDHDEGRGSGRDVLTLQEAADRLKVHYMTAYRWVRRGELPAFKTGGRLRVRVADLDAFVEQRSVEVALPSAGAARRTDWNLHVERFHEDLREGRGAAAGALVRKVIADGASAGDVYLHLLTPALHRIGDDWEAGLISVAEEHRATEICKAVLARLGEGFRRRGPSQGSIVTLTPADEEHGIASTMVADFLRGAGFEVHHLGANVPAEDLGLFLQVWPSDAVCASVTVDDADPGRLRELVATVVEGAAIPTFLGGQGVTPELAREIGAVHVPELATLARSVTGVLSSEEAD